MVKALLLINVKGWLWKMNNASRAHFDGWKTLARIRTWRNIWILSPLNIQQTEKNSCHFQVKGWMSEYLWSQKFMSSSWKIRNGDTFWFLPSQRCPQKTFDLWQDLGLNCSGRFLLCVNLNFATHWLPPETSFLNFTILPISTNWVDIFKRNCWKGQILDTEEEMIFLRWLAWISLGLH